MRVLRLATRGQPASPLSAAPPRRRRSCGAARPACAPPGRRRGRQRRPRHAALLTRMPTVGVFIQARQASLAGEADCGVHSCKDLPTGSPVGVVLAACLRRADPRDALIGASGIAALPGALVTVVACTGAAVVLRPDLRFADLAATSRPACARSRPATSRRP